ncbi:hypothetical protein AMTR_s00302p00018610 [Amborella trichopoda]|uniref:Uncharacterized protein n=1 Tax=Amborella trichopoda TaxID=13333 RepID=U5CZ73_AMBTC|nr:hypothetical protein AMTR_s00302p00018610 [Amborella trichopoda]
MRTLLTSHHKFSKPKLPSSAIISLNPDLIAAIKGSRDHIIDIPLASMAAKGSRSQSSHFGVVGISSSSSEDFEEGAHEAASKGRLKKNPTQIKQLAYKS